LGTLVCIFWETNTVKKYTKKTTDVSLKPASKKKITYRVNLGQVGKRALCGCKNQITEFAIWMLSYFQLMDQNSGTLFRI